MSVFVTKKDLYKKSNCFMFSSPTHAIDAVLELAKKSRGIEKALNKDFFMPIFL